MFPLFISDFFPFLLFSFNPFQKKKKEKVSHEAPEIEEILLTIFEDEGDEWTSPIHHMIAGSAAGVAEHCAVFPLDTIKVSEREKREKRKEKREKRKEKREKRKEKKEKGREKGKENLSLFLSLTGFSRTALSLFDSFSLLFF